MFFKRKEKPVEQKCEVDKKTAISLSEEFDKTCIKLWGKPFDELSKKDQQEAIFIATFN